MSVLKGLLGSKFTTLLALVAAIVGVVNHPDFAGLVPENWAAILATVGSVVASLSRALVDTDKDGVPDIVDPD